MRRAAARQARQERRAPPPVAAEPPPPETPPEKSWADRLNTLTTFGPPITIITGLLIWYGYVATYQRFRFFGVYLELADLSNQDLILFGVETIYPAAALLLFGFLLILLVHAVVTRQLAAGRNRTMRVVAALSMAGGAALTVRGLIGLVNARVSADESPGVTPLSLAFGAPLLVYGLWILSRTGRDFLSAGATRTARIIAAGIAVVGLFWGGGSLAAEVGVARGLEDAKTLATRPAVVLYCKEPIIDVPPEIQYDDFGEAFPHRHRYQGFRLLLESHDRLFLVPLTWQPTDTTVAISTFVLPYDDGIRLQLMAP
ncbi:hypothetical protein Acor_13640 [Acrocarpospora corrugata]|uniref:Uncharacterized protein n=1 Tax=Acrocarpospora corrugata TaxID=35763 RepID=A0A5M3VX03_9ACTN|nr:hypothetical protein [Acrocarpospora corrugata]GER99300.1 hypothetical protein Acor_13640 [Acrocarpospora corrugata]